MPRNVSSKRTRKNLRVAGGAGASQYAEFVFGGPDAQKAVVAGSNVIATNDPTGYTPDAVGDKMPEIKGGRKSKKGGKGMLTDIAVPALLLYANTVVKRRSNKVYGNKGSKKSRKNLRK